MDNNKLFKRLQAYKQNPDFIRPLENNELAELVLVLLGHIREVEGAIKEGRLKGDPGKDGVTPVPDKDYASKATTEALVRRLMDDVRATITPGKPGAPGKNGKDAEITDEHIKKAADLAAKMITSPDYEEMIETLFETNTAYLDEKLETTVEELREELKRVKRADTAYGATIARRLEQIGNVTITTPRHNQLMQYNSTTKTWVNTFALTVSDTEPTDAEEGDIWIDTGA